MLHVDTEVSNQAARAIRAAAHLNYAIWWNKHVRTEAKARIYKTVIRPTLIYAVRSETSKTQRILEATQVKMTQRIAGKTLRDRERNERHAGWIKSMTGY